jgi:hypothetical protein
MCTFGVQIIIFHWSEGGQRSGPTGAFSGRRWGFIPHTGGEVKGSNPIEGVNEETRRFLMSWHSVPTSLNTASREYLMIYRGPGLLAVL